MISMHACRRSIWRSLASLIMRVFCSCALDTKKDKERLCVFDPIKWRGAHRPFVVERSPRLLHIRWHPRKVIMSHKYVLLVVDYKCHHKYSFRCWLQMSTRNYMNTIHEHDTWTRKRHQGWSCDRYSTPHPCLIELFREGLVAVVPAETRDVAICPPTLVAHGTKWHKFFIVSNFCACMYIHVGVSCTE